jgi:hypothetical protein
VRKSLTLSAVLPVLAAGLVACGGSTDSTDSGESVKTFDQEGFQITFEYPGNWVDAGDITISDNLGGTTNATKGVAIDNDNLIAVSLYELNQEVTDQNIDRAKSTLDRLYSKLAPGVQGTTGETGGLPSVTYEQIPISDPAGAESDITAVFNGRQEYLINCQSTSAHTDEVNSACEHALSTLKAK